MVMEGLPSFLSGPARLDAMVGKAGQGVAGYDRLDFGCAQVSSHPVLKTPHHHMERISED